MSTYDLGKSVAVTLLRHGKPEPGEVGVNTDRTIFGYVARGELTHMSYRLNEYFVPANVISARREKGIPFYFHAGDRLSISASELERAFRELGLL
jgi:glucose-6-phosphate 1-dehydrogenase